MKIEVRLIPDLPHDSKEEIKAEIAVLTDILGSEGLPCAEIDYDLINGLREKRYVLWTGDFWELYKRIKDRIYRRLEAQK